MIVQPKRDVMTVKIKVLGVFGNFYEQTRRHYREDLQLQSSSEHGSAGRVVFMMLG